MTKGDTDKKKENAAEDGGEDGVDDPLSSIDFDVPKFDRKALNVDLETFASVLDYELSRREWFVTGNVCPEYFDSKFKFEDPDVKLDGIENYARGVNKLFDQQTSRAEIMSTEVVSSGAAGAEDKMITVTWRLSGRVNIGGGLTIKPYVVYTDFKMDPDSGSVVFQRDRFDLPQWDILLSALFPFLIGKVTAPPAPPVPAREVPRPKILDKAKASSPLFGVGAINKMFGRRQE